MPLTARALRFFPGKRIHNRNERPGAASGQLGPPGEHGPSLAAAAVSPTREGRAVLHLPLCAAAAATTAAMGAIQRLTRPSASTRRVSAKILALLALLGTSFLAGMRSPNSLAQLRD